MHRNLPMRICAFTLTLIVGGFLIVAPVRAQFTDPVTAPAQVTLGVGFGFMSSYEQGQNILVEVLKDVAATAFKGAVSSVLNTIAAETAKGLATGNFNGPMFNFDSGFLSGLADAVAGDLIYDLVNDLVPGGFNICNLDPKFSLNIALNLPLFKEYEYKPKCSLTEIAEQVQKLKLENIFQLNINVSTQSVESFAQFEQSVESDPELFSANIGEAAKAVAEKYSDEDTAYNANLKTDLEAIQSFFEGVVSAKPLEADALRAKKRTYLCELLRDAQSHNIALLGQIDFAKAQDLNQCQGAKDSENKDIELDLAQWSAQWSNDVIDIGKGWLRATPEKRTGNAQALLNEIKNDIDRTALTANNPLDAGTRRVGHYYNKCDLAMQKVLGSVKLENTVMVGADVSGSQTTGVTFTLATDPPSGTYTNATNPGPTQPDATIRGESFDFILQKPAEYVGLIFFTTDGTDPRCDRCRNSAGQFTSQNNQVDCNAAGHDWITGRGTVVGFTRDRTNVPAITTFPDGDADGENELIKAVACVDPSQGRPAVDTGVQTFNFVVDSDYRVPSAEEQALAKAGSRFRETFRTKLPDPNHPAIQRDATITYSQGGAKLTDKEVALCQIAFNSGTLMRSFWTPFTPLYRDGANKYPKDGSVTRAGIPVVGVLAQRGGLLGDFAGLFHPEYMEASTHDWFRFIGEATDATNRSDYFQAFIRYTVERDAEEAGSGEQMRAKLLELISEASSHVNGLQRAMLRQYTDVSRIFDSAIQDLEGQVEDVQSTDERLAEEFKNLEDSNQKNTFAKFTQKAVSEKAAKKDEETTAALEKGTALNPNKTAVSDQATNVAEVQLFQLKQLPDALKDMCSGHTGRILADAMNTFLCTLWNEALASGLRNLNPILAESGFVNLNVSPELQKKMDEQQRCIDDPSQCRTALAGQSFSECNANDLDIIRSWDTIAKSVGNLVQTGDAAASDEAEEALIFADVSSGCRAAFKKAQEQGASQEEALEEADNQASASGAPTTQGPVLPSPNIQLDPTAAISVDVAQRAEGRAVSGFNNPFENNEISKLNIEPVNDLNLLQQLFECPRGENNPSLYNCTIDAKFNTAIIEGITIRQAIEKGYINGNSAVGVDQGGIPPRPGAGFSLASAQKLRKARVMPVGFEFATRLKVACYQDSLMPIPGIPGNYPYKDISGECRFPGVGGQMLDRTSSEHVALRDQVIQANLQDILDGFSQTGGVNGTCGEFGGNQLNMSPFCNLLNPDWVIKLPNAQCGMEQEYTDILEAKSSYNRSQSCSELQSELKKDSGQYGYCVKEENTWKFPGQSCPNQYSTCQAYVFRDGSTHAFNRDSLLGEGLCNENNAGCFWVSTVKQGSQWVDTINIRDRLDCIRSGGSWDEFAIGAKCSNSRLYLNDNVEFCTSSDAGCSEVKQVRVEGNNLVKDSGFEFTSENSVQPFWTAGTRELTSDPNACVAGGGTVSNICSQVLFRDATSCNANGGRLVNGVCEGATLSNVTEQRCGVCTYEGANPAADISRSLFTEGTCDSQTDHRWESGQYDTYCELNEIVCRNNAGSCTKVFSDYNGDSNSCIQFGGVFYEEACVVDGPEDIDERIVDTITTPSACRDACTADGGTLVDGQCQGGLGHDWQEFGPNNGICRSTNNEGEVSVPSFDNDPIACLRNGGSFGLSCPMTVQRREQLGGTKSLVIDLNNFNYELGEDIIIEYPIETPVQATPIILAGDTYSLQFNIKTNGSPIEARAELVKTFNGGRTDRQARIISIDDVYRRYEISLTTLSSGTDLTLRIIVPAFGELGTQANIFVDNVKIEYNSPRQIFNNQPLISGYSDYSDNSSIMVKMPPDHLKCLGFGSDNPAPRALYEDQPTCELNGLYWDNTGTFGGGEQCYQYPPDRQECFNYSRSCRPDEAGCQLYTPSTNSPDVPGIIGRDDFCPAECVGYETFKQQASYFEPTPLAPINYFIPDTAQSCTVRDVGCDEFTNLSLAAGEDPIEYYNYLRQCILPNTGMGEASYFIWQGSADGPPQLRTFTLQAEGGSCAGAADGQPHANDPLGCETNGGNFSYDGNLGPAVISVDGFCEEDDLGRDLDCLRFFDSQGNSYFRKLSYTITTSVDCVTLRKTVSNEESCEATNGNWQAADDICLYQALPRQSAQCSAEVNGCREYLGNTGRNSFNVIFDTFETATLHQWFDGVSGDITRPVVSSESVTTLGRSIFVDPSVSTINRRAIIRTGGSYKLSFWAKNSETVAKNIGVRFSTAPGGDEFVTVESGLASVDTEWRQYEFGPIFVDWQETPGNRLIVDNVGNIFLDNIILTELPESVFVIKDSWQTPQSCEVTNLGVSMPQAQLGCQEYEDSSNNTVYLKSFSRLCRESAVGCQLVFDTQNSRSPLAQTFNTDNISELDNVQVVEDEMRAVIITEDSLCSAQSRGCMEVGITQIVSPTSLNQAIFVKNDPDRYTSAIDPILCRNEELGCVELVNSQGNKDFLKVNFAERCVYAENPVVMSRLVNGQIVDTPVNGWFDRGTTQGCLASAETTKVACEDAGGSWNAEWGQCVTDVQGISFNDCTTPVFTDEYLDSLQSSCVSDHKGSWYFEGALGCGCARYPFDYYRADEAANLRHVQPASCPIQYDQCTEFLDFNPNYIFNGDFEQAEPNIPDLPQNWSENLDTEGTGRTALLRSGATQGGQALRMTKLTSKEMPGDTSLQLINTPFRIEQLSSRLEKGRSYDLNFEFQVDRIGSIGSLGRLDVGNCRMPEAAIEVVPFINDNARRLFDRSDLEYTNKQNLQIFESQGGWQKAKTSFSVPRYGIALPIFNSELDEFGLPNDDTGRENFCISDPRRPGIDYGYAGFWGDDAEEDVVMDELDTQSACESEGFNWDTTEEECIATTSCFLNDPTESTVDYEIRIYSPLNGACVNQRTGEQRYFDDQGRPLDKYTCEGVSSANMSEIAERLGGMDPIADQIRDVRYPEYGDRFLGGNLLDLDDVTDLGERDSWLWQGNCPNSNYTIDKFQIAPRREVRYTFVDNQDIDRRSCTGVNWDAGCIEFENVLSGERDVIQVKPDRQCSEWLFCEERNAQGQCKVWTTCKEQSGERCVRLGSLTDPLRYQLNDSGKLTSIDIHNYRSRLGEFEDFRLTRWRAGDYSGYTIPNLPPIEQLYNQVPPINLANLADAPDPVTPAPKFADKLEDSDYLVENANQATSGSLTIKDKLLLMCRGYAERTSPFPAALKRLVPGFSGVFGLFSDDGSSIPVNERTELCSYVRYDFEGQQRYFTGRPDSISVMGACVGGHKPGLLCTNDDDCLTPSGGVPGTCTKIEELPSDIFQSIGEKNLQGKLGVCLEEESLIKITGGYNPNPVFEDPLGNRASPNACLTFFPY